MVSALDRLGALLARLRVSRQLALLGVVLLVPAVLAGRAYHDAQSLQIDFSAQERVGVKALGPANGLLVAAVRARSAAVKAALAHQAPPAAQLDAVRAAVKRNDAAVGEVGDDLGDAAKWKTARTAVLARLDGSAGATAADTLKSY